ncbi:MAG TPA: hypothetical protein VMI54_29975 [Polyangiaceae bacterium]|nr:hypothetical protein [Polyangiaceae bacterium]
MLRSRGLVAGALLTAACGGSKPPAEAPAAAPEKPAATPATDSDPPSAAPEAPASTAGSALPKECAKKSSTCVPPRPFVEKLCSGSYPSVALYLFANKSPWARGYLKGRTKAWNASGGASDNTWLEFDEEVLVLAVRKADLGGMQVSGGGGASYDALRWDGSCVTLSGDEMTLDKPPAPKNSRVEWRFLDDNVQAALRADATVNDAYLSRRKECKGATSGEVSGKCVKADDRLSAEVVKYIRSGGALPEPTKVP